MWHFKPFELLFLELILVESLNPSCEVAQALREVHMRAFLGPCLRASCLSIRVVSSLVMLVRSRKVAFKVTVFHRKAFDRVRPC